MSPRGGGDAACIVRGRRIEAIPLPRIWPATETRTKNVTCSYGNLRLLGRVRLRKKKSEHRDGDHDVVSHDMRVEAAMLLVAREHPVDDRRHPGAKMFGTRVVTLRSDQVDESCRAHRLFGDAVEEVTQASIRLGREGLQVVDVVVEDGQRQGDAVGKVPVEAALADAGAARDSAQRGTESPLGEHLTGRIDQGLAIDRTRTRASVRFRFR